MYHSRFNLVDDSQQEDRPVLPSISRIFDNGNSRTPSSLRLPPLPAGQQQVPTRQVAIRADTWPQFPLSATQDYSYNANSPMLNDPSRIPSPARDPRVSALETNRAMSALASARESVPTRQYPYGDRYQYREEHGYLPAGHGEYGYPYNDSRSTTPGQTGYPRSHHTVHGMRDLDPASPNPVYPRSMFDLRGHGGESSSNTRHQCGYCGKRFSRPSGLKIHITTHTGEKPYVCPEEGCHRSFSVRSNMRRHVRIVHQVTPEEDSSEDGESREEM